MMKDFDKVLGLTNMHLLASMAELDYQFPLPCLDMGGVELLSRQSRASLKASSRPNASS